MNKAQWVKVRAWAANRNACVLAFAATILAFGFGCRDAAANGEPEQQRVALHAVNVTVDDVALWEPFGTPNGVSSKAVAGALAEPAEEPLLDIVNCGLYVHNPHKSGHKRGTINVVARVECDHPVARIELKVGLALNGHEVATMIYANSGVAALGGNVATLCVSGAYTGGAAAEVTFFQPALPWSRTLHSSSATVKIDCP